MVLATIIIAITITVVFILANRPTQAATLSVPGTFPTIQSAINRANNGDEIVVSPGTYRENLEIVGKYITVRSSSGSDVTTIAGNPGKTPVMIQNVPYREGAKTQLSGFRITGGYAPDGQGGGITVANNADPIINNNKIENNRSNSQGGGILVFNNSNPHIRNNIIQNNSAYMFGGGIFVVKNSAPTISDNQITANSVAGASIPNGGSSGGGIYLENDTSNPSSKSSPVVFRNSIKNNSAEFAGGGIMLRVGVDAIIEDNSIESNSAPYGGGIHVETEGSRPVITGNSILSNIAKRSSRFQGSGHGGGISVYASSKPEITANTIQGNQSSKGGGGIVIAENASPRITANQLKSNSTTESNGDGGGIYVANATASVTNNVIDSNSSTHVGGGIAVLGGSTISLVNNTIVNNKAVQSIGGGGIFVANSSRTAVSIVNNVIDSNEKYQIFEELPKAVIDNNVITNTGSGIYFNYNSNGISTSSNLNSSNSVSASANKDSDPLFIDKQAANYKLQSTSQAIDMGKNANNNDDFSLIRRPFGQSSDAGAYEYTDSSGLQKSIVYRFWSDTYRSHFYTINKAERDTLLSSHHPKEWRYESTAYYAYTDQVPGSQPLYRFWSSEFKGHFYTASQAERDYINNNYPESTWKYEGVAYYVYPLNYSFDSRTLTVDRFWSNSYKHHFYTASQAESQYVRNSLGNIWSYESGRFKVPL